MCLLGIVERPGVSWGVLGCPGVIRLTPLAIVLSKERNSKKLVLTLMNLSVIPLMLLHAPFTVCDQWGLLLKPSKKPHWRYFTSVNCLDSPRHGIYTNSTAKRK